MCSGRKKKAECFVIARNEQVGQGQIIFCLMQNLESRKENRGKKRKNISISYIEVFIDMEIIKITVEKKIFFPFLVWEHLILNVKIILFFLYFMLAMYNWLFWGSVFMTVFVIQTNLLDIFNSQIIHSIIFPNKQERKESYLFCMSNQHQLLEYYILNLKFFF